MSLEHRVGGYEPEEDASARRLAQAILNNPRLKEVLEEVYDLAFLTLARHYTYYSPERLKEIHSGARLKVLVQSVTPWFQPGS